MIVSTKRILELMRARVGLQTTKNHHLRRQEMAKKSNNEWENVPSEEEKQDNYLD
jgi:hypothetical protein